MLKRIVIGSLALANMLVGASPAFAYDPPLEVYFTYYYSDASHSTGVGHSHFEYCTFNGRTNGAVYSVVGSSSIYHDDNLIGYCEDGNFGPA
ncbi:MAG: hypothetical protein QOJ91_1720 [Sphingomonadales bacterium]|jgi:hypothetical protein|nr:hypothetical protein [Sphingomonadales bacterium]